MQFLDILAIGMRAIFFILKWAIIFAICWMVWYAINSLLKIIKNYCIPQIWKSNVKIYGHVDGELILDGTEWRIALNKHSNKSYAIPFTLRPKK